jgi:hypothetical protein
VNAIGPSYLDRPSHGLWSLWDMLELDACPFYFLMATFEKLKSVIETKESEKEYLVPGASRIPSFFDI